MDFAPDYSKNTPGPETVVFRPLAVDYKELVNYACKKGVAPCDLTESEKQFFVIS